MAAVTISITDHQRAFVEAEVQGGGYSNVSEVVRAALRLLEHQRLEREAQLRDLRAAIDEGDNSVAAPWEGAEAIQRMARECHASRTGQSIGEQV